MAQTLDRPAPAAQTSDLDAADRAAHRASITRPIAEVASDLQSTLGQRLAAVIVGVADAKAVGRWARKERAPHSDTETRLRAALRVVLLLRERYAPETVRAWFGGMNPLLNDRAPALVLDANPEEVLEAAREFWAHG